jgi:thioredoxin-dependent peroxiredoxin
LRGLIYTTQIRILATGCHPTSITLVSFAEYYKMYGLRLDILVLQEIKCTTFTCCAVNKVDYMKDLIGTQVPEVTFKIRIPKETVTGTCSAIDAEWGTLSTDEIFKGKKVILFALPGAFTPTCSSTHLPGYEAKFEELKAMGIDDVVCLSVNDPFVMYEWGRGQNLSKVRLIPDGSGEFTEKIGMLVAKNNLGFGNRSWRYSMFVDNGEIKQVFAEPGFGDNAEADPFEVSDVNTMMEYLKTV